MAKRDTYVLIAVALCVAVLLFRNVSGYEFECKDLKCPLEMRKMRDPKKTSTCRCERPQTMQNKIM